MKIIKSDDNVKIDDKTFNFVYRDENIFKSLFVPIAQVNNRYYKLGNFSHFPDEYILIENLKTLKECLEFAINNFEYEFNIIELSNIYSIILHNNFNIKDFDVFKQYKIFSERQFNVLEKIIKFPEELKKYIVEKNISLKLLSILTKFDNLLISRINDYVCKRNPSVSNFRILINSVYDFKDKININNDLESEIRILKDNSNLNQLKFIKLIDDILKPIGNNIKIANVNNFELCNFLVSFEIISAEDFNEKVKTLKSFSNNIEKIFSILKENDLC